jgi:tRNA G37 N-methylase TrmD
MVCSNIRNIHARRIPRLEGTRGALAGQPCAASQWKREQSLIRTLLFRPDLLLNAGLSEKDRSFLEKFMASQLKGLSPHKPTSN